MFLPVAAAGNYFSILTVSVAIHVFGWLNLGEKEQNDPSNVNIAT